MAKSKLEKTAAVRDGLTAAHRENLYEAARFLNGPTRGRIGLSLPCTIFVQDQATAKANPELGLQEIELRWEPGLGPGPTSARLAVVDYDGDTGVLQPPAQWDEKAFRFLAANNKPVDEARDSPQFRQVNAWATVQRVLEYYEQMLGRPVPWGFAGHRLLIVPQAGFRENAFYDRHSKSLQLYYFGDAGAPSYNCLSHDVIAHETGHALLDGIRPYFLEHSSWETAAFHEFVGDLTAILLALRNNDVRGHLKETFGADLERAEFLADVAEEFGRLVEGRRFLRTARNAVSFAEAQEVRSAHHCSQVLTGAMFTILVRIADQYLSARRQAERAARATPGNALWWAVDRFGRTALQPLDLLPPVDVRFLDYARAVLRNDELNDPADLHGYRALIRRVFHERKLCPQPFDERHEKTCPLAAPKLPVLKVFHDMAEVSRSRVAAYHLLHDNREALGIPARQDFVIADLYDCNKRQADQRLPRQIVVQYLWREEVKLEGERFGRFAGETVDLLCGGTLVFDDRSNLLWCATKPGRDSEEGAARQAELLEHMARIVEERRLTLTDDPDPAVLAGHPAAVVARRVGGSLRLESTPHLCGAAAGEEEEQWSTSF